MARERGSSSTVDMSSMSSDDDGTHDLEIPVSMAHRRSSVSMAEKSRHDGRQVTMLDDSHDGPGNPRPGGRRVSIFQQNPQNARRMSTFQTNQARRMSTIQVLAHAAERRLSENLAINKKEPRSDRNPCAETAVDFIEKTNMHGFKMLGEPHPAQRIFWAFACLVATGFGVYLVTLLVIKWQDEPILVSFDTSSTPIWEVPFPAITICNMNHVKRSQAQDIINELNDTATPDDEVIIKALLIEDLCDIDLHVDEDLVANMTDGQLEDMEEFLDSLGHSCEDMVQRCTLYGDPVPCSDLFKDVHTDLGRCCAFNVVDNEFLQTRDPTEDDFLQTRDDTEDDFLQTRDDTEPEPESERTWSLQEGYKNAFKKRSDEKPYRTLASGLSNGISFVLNVQSDEYFCSRYESQGFRVKLHDPTSVPVISDYGFVVSSGNEFVIPVMPAVIDADPAIFHVDPAVRQCFLSHERRLTFFAHYTDENCFMECATNHTHGTCGCVPHYLPHLESQPVCGPSQLECARDVVNSLRENFEEDVAGGCNCMKSCTELDYDKEMSHSPIHKLRANATGPVLNKTDAAILHVFFKKENFFKQVRSERFGVIDFLSNAGGLLSLCMGFSVISIVELIYFFYLKLFCRCGKFTQKVDKD